MRVLGKLMLVSLGVLALMTACKTSTAAGGGAGEADGGMGSAVEGAKSGVESAAQGAADAGAEAYGAAREKASGAASTAADAAKSAGSAAADAGAEAYGAAKEKVESATSGGEDGGTAESGGARAEAPTSDGQIAAIVHAANQGDLLKSQLAKKRTKNAKVKAFANLMIKDHKAMDAQAKKLGLEPEENETSRSLTQGAQDALSKLEGLKGKEFDTAYAENEVSSHEKVIKTVEEQLIPGAKDARLKKLLESADKKLKTHLEHAQKLQSDLSK